MTKDQPPASAGSSVSRPNPLPILAGSNKCLYHLGADEVAAESIQLSQPKVVARIVSVRRIVRIAPQVPDVLHQHKRAIEFLATQACILSHVAQRPRSRRHIAGVCG